MINNLNIIVPLKNEDQQVETTVDDLNSELDQNNLKELLNQNLKNDYKIKFNDNSNKVISFKEKPI